MPTRLSFDRVATIYDETRGLAPRAMTRLLAVLVDEFQRKRVLEVGVGTGRYAVPLQKSGLRVVGVDISRSMVEFGLAKGLRDVVFADGAHLPFDRQSFEAATTNHVLHLISDWRDVLREIARVTRETYFTVNGRRVPTELDPDAGALRWRPREKPKPGPLRIEAVATDEAGNRARLAGTLVVR